MTDTAALLRAGNASPMTLSGTNTWVLRAGGAAVLVDPGPQDPEHLAAIADVGEIALILLTHGHPDHSDAVGAVHAATGAPVRARDAAWCRDAPALAADETIVCAGVQLRVLATPGHTADSACFVLTGDGAGSVLTGDTMLGEGTTVVAYPDGRLAPYLESLRRLSSLAGMRVLPGHGPPLADAARAARAYLAHREMRLKQVRDAVRAGDTTSWEVVRRVYADVDPVLWPAAERSVRAQLEYLAPEGLSEAPPATSAPAAAPRESGRDPVQQGEVSR